MLDGDAAALVGQHVSHGRGSHTNLADLMQALSMCGGSSGSRSAQEVYCGLAEGLAEDALAESSQGQRHAWVGVSTTYIDYLLRASSIRYTFTAMMEVARGADGQKIIDNTRAGAFNFLDARNTERVVDERDSTLWWRGKDEDENWLEVAKAALFWTMSHELAHLLQGDLDRRPDRTLGDLRSRAGQDRSAGLWPETPEHQSETRADFGAGEQYLNLALKPFDLGVMMQGSFVAMAVLAVDGWFVDGSQHSSTHPSPFLRNWSLLSYWLHWLRDMRDADWATEGQPTREALRKVADAFLVIEWLGGVYRSTREGLVAAQNDFDALHAVLCEAAGLPRTTFISLDPGAMAIFD